MVEDESPINLILEGVPKPDLTAVDARDGRIVWKIANNDMIFGEVYDKEDQALYLVTLKRIYKINTYTGEYSWISDVNLADPTYWECNNCRPGKCPDDNGFGCAGF